MNKRIEYEVSVCVCVWVFCVNALDMVFRLNILFSKKKLKWGENILRRLLLNSDGTVENWTKTKPKNEKKNIRVELDMVIN